MCISADWCFNAFAVVYHRRACILVNVKTSTSTLWTHLLISLFLLLLLRRFFLFFSFCFTFSIARFIARKYVWVCIIYTWYRCRYRCTCTYVCFIDAWIVWVWVFECVKSLWRYFYSAWYFSTVTFIMCEYINEVALLI